MVGSNKDSHLIFPVWIKLVDVIVQAFENLLTAQKSFQASGKEVRDDLQGGQLSMALTWCIKSSSEAIFWLAPEYGRC